MALSSVPFATNPYGVRTRPINFNAPGAPTAKTYHGLSIVVNGKIIGRIQSWNPQMYSRDGSHIWELNHLTFGRPVDYVPSVNRNYSVSCSRVEVWNQEFEIALGFAAVFADLIDQDKPFTIQEFLFRGTQVYRTWQYLGCWFADRNEAEFGAEGDAKVISNANINFVSRIRTV